MNLALELGVTSSTENCTAEPAGTGWLGEDLWTVRGISKAGHAAWKCIVTVLRKPCRHQAGPQEAPSTGRQAIRQSLGLPGRRLWKPSLPGEPSLTGLVCCPSSCVPVPRPRSSAGGTSAVQSGLPTSCVTPTGKYQQVSLLLSHVTRQRV